MSTPLSHSILFFNAFIQFVHSYALPTGDLYYFNFASGESAWEHPMDEFFKKLVVLERDKLQRPGGLPKRSLSDIPTRSLRNILLINFGLRLMPQVFVTTQQSLSGAQFRQLVLGPRGSHLRLGGGGGGHPRALSDSIGGGGFGTQQVSRSQPRWVSSQRSSARGHTWPLDFPACVHFIFVFTLFPPAVFSNTLT